MTGSSVSGARAGQAAHTGETATQGQQTTQRKGPISVLRSKLGGAWLPRFIVNKGRRHPPHDISRTEHHLDSQATGQNENLQKELKECLHSRNAQQLREDNISKFKIIVVKGIKDYFSDKNINDRKLWNPKNLKILIKQHANSLKYEQINAKEEYDIRNAVINELTTNTALTLLSKNIEEKKAQKQDSSKKEGYGKNFIINFPREEKAQKQDSSKKEGYGKNFIINFPREENNDKNYSDAMLESLLTTLEDGLKPIIDLVRTASLGIQEKQDLTLHIANLKAGYAHLTILNDKCEKILASDRDVWISRMNTYVDGEIEDLIPVHAAFLDASKRVILTGRELTSLIELCEFYKKKDDLDAFLKEHEVDAFFKKKEEDDLDAFRNKKYDDLDVFLKEDELDTF